VQQKSEKILIKTIIYRIYSIVIAYLVFYLLTGKIMKATKFTIILELTKLCQYYLFEKLWKKIQ